MIIQKVKYRGKNLYATSEQLSSGNLIALNQAELWEISTHQSGEELQTRHGVSNSPALLGSRKITLEGVIIAESETKRSELIKELDQTFAPQIQVNFGEDGNLPLYFEDAEEKRWCIYAQVSKLPQKTSSLDDPNMVSWKVELIANDPFIYSAASYTADDTNRTQSLSLPISLGDEFTEGWKTLTYAGTIPNDLNISITTTEDNATDGQLKIYNLTSGEVFQIEELELDEGDVLVINTTDRMITLNDEDITYKKVGATWPNLIPGENQLRIDTNVESVRLSAEYSWREMWV